MQTLSLTCFGVGDGMPCGDRNHSAYLYRLADTTFLVDCGDPISRSYKASGLSYELIDRIFISHLHSDHVGGFLMLLQSLWLEQRRKDLSVHLPADGIEPLRRMAQAAYLFDELLPFRLRFEPLQARRPAVHGPVRVTPYPNSHLAGFRKAYQGRHPGEYAAYSFLIEKDDFRGVHTADLGGVSDLDALLADPVNLLVCELSHFRAEELFDYLKDRPIQHAVFVHLGRSYWSQLGEIRKLAARMLPRFRVSFPQDLDTVRL
jgi:phosphoribosyl 1,2-cyclic phosphodiesterase